MKKIITLLSFLVFMINAFSQNTDTKLYELRIYYCHPNRLGALIERFTNHTTKLFEKHGMTNVGYWLPVHNDSLNALYYILAFPDKAARESSWKNFISDPEWKTVQSKSEESGKIVAKVESIFLNATEYSPLIKSVDAGKERVFELRTYYCMPGKLANINARFKDFTIASFQKYGMTNIGYWNTVEAADSIQPKLVYLLAHNSEEAAKASFDNFRADPERKKVFDASEANGKIVDRIQSVFLKPLPFSKIK